MIIYMIIDLLGQLPVCAIDRHPQRDDKRNMKIT